MSGCIFLKNLTLKVIDNSFIAQCNVCEVILQNQKFYVDVTYRSPSQSFTEFDEFLSNFDKLLNHIKQFRSSFTIILGYLRGNKVRGIVTILNFKDPLNKSLGTHPKVKNSIMIV